MSQYISLLLWIGFMGILSRFPLFKKKVLVSGEYVYRSRWFIAILTFAPIVWMAAYRTNAMGDTFVYRSMFYSIPQNFSGAVEFIEQHTKDKGFYAFCALLRQFLPDNKVPFFASIALIQAFALAKLYRKYSKDFVFCVFLFVASTDYYNWMFNGIRQFTAVAIILLATPYLFEKKYVRLILMILLASTFHQSALIMLPIVFIVQGKAWNKKTLLLILLVILSITFVSQFTQVLDSALEDTQYENVVSDYQEIDDDGTNIFRALIYCIPAFLSLYGLKKIKNKKNNVINICTNMSIVSAGIYAISTVTSGIFIGRLPIYCSLYSYILLDWEINNLFEKNMQKIIKFFAIVGYLLFYYIQMHIFRNIF